MKCLKNSQGGAARHLGDTLDSRFGQRPSSAKWFKSQLENSVKSLTVFAATAFELGQEFQAEATAFAEGHFDQAHTAANKAIQDNLKHAPNHAHFRIKAAMPWVHGGFFMQRKADYAIFFACTWRLFDGQHEQHHFSPYA